MQEEQALQGFGVLANAARLRILRALIQAGEPGLNAGALADLIEASPSRASFHLSAMAAAGLVTTKRQARQVIYQADFAALGGLVRFLLEDCCGNDQRVRGCCNL